MGENRGEARFIDDGLFGVLLVVMHSDCSRKR